MIPNKILKEFIVLNDVFRSRTDESNCVRKLTGCLRLGYFLAMGLIIITSFPVVEFDFFNI